MIGLRGSGDDLYPVVRLINGVGRLSGSSRQDFDRFFQLNLSLFAQQNTVYEGIETLLALLSLHGCSTAKELA